MKLNLTPVNMTTAQAHAWIHRGFADDEVIAKLGRKTIEGMIKALNKAYEAERKAGVPNFYVPTPIQNDAIAYLEGLRGEPPSWVNIYVVA